MTKVKTIKVQNLKAVEAMEVDFNGCTAIITGGNGKGKSSFLKSLPERIRGNKPSEIVKRGEEDGFAEWELTDGSRFVWQFDTKTKKGEKLKFITKDNITTNVTKEIARRYFPPVFDIDSFLHAGPQKQFKMIQELTGVDLENINARYSAAYNERTVLNRIAKEAKARTVEIDHEPISEKSSEELEKELHSIGEFNKRIDYVEKGMKDKKLDINQNKAEIKRLQNMIERLEKKNEEIAADIEKGKEFLKSNKRKTNQQELEVQIDEIKQHNQRVVQYENQLAINEEYNVAQQKADEQDAVVKEIEEEKLAAIAEAKLPSEFEIVDGEIRFQGFAMNKEQLSSSAIYIAALKLASLQLGQVKVLHFDASYLDKNNLQQIEEWANENDLQLLIERPDFDGGEISYELINCEQ